MITNKKNIFDKKIWEKSIKIKFLKDRKMNEQGSLISDK